MRDDELRTTIEAIVASGSNVSDGMQALVTRLAARRPATVLWERVAAIRWQDDVADAEAWLRGFVAVARPHPAVRWLYFALGPQDHPDASLDLFGHTRYEPHDTSVDEEPCYPAPGWCPSLLLRSVALACKVDRMRTEAQRMADHALPLAYAALLVRTIGPRVPGLLAGATERGVRVGFPGGDWIDLGLLTGARWAPARLLERLDRSPAPADHEPEAERRFLRLINEQALAYHDALLERDPDDAERLVARAKIRVRLDDDRAGGDLERAIGLLPAGSRREKLEQVLAALRRGARPRRKRLTP